MVLRLRLSSVTSAKEERGGGRRELCTLPRRVVQYPKDEQLRSSSGEQVESEAYRQWADGTLSSAKRSVKNALRRQIARDVMGEKSLGVGTARCPCVPAIPARPTGVRSRSLVSQLVYSIHIPFVPPRLHVCCVE